MKMPTTRASWWERERLDPLHSFYSYRPEESVIEDNANWLIDHLYVPDAEVGAVAQPDYPETGLEPINWGDLSVCDVIRHGDGWQVTVEEAAPGRCPDLCEYLRGWLEKWGWDNVEVVTEW